jgi:hypothetical protein
MGFLSNILGNSTPEKSGGGSNAALTGGHNISASNALRATDPTVFSPTNPGNFDSLRTCMVLDKPRYFTAEEAQKFKTIARETSEGVRHTKTAIKALTKIDTNDRKVHNNYYRKYAPKIADNELSKLRATNSYAKHLHSIRPGYAGLQQSLEQAEQKADVMVSNIRESLKAAL